MKEIDEYLSKLESFIEDSDFYFRSGNDLEFVNGDFNIEKGDLVIRKELSEEIIDQWKLIKEELLSYSKY